MPRPYSQDLRWIWLTVIMELEIDEICLLLQISKRTISRYVQKTVTSTQPLSKDHIPA